MLLLLLTDGTPQFFFYVVTENLANGLIRIDKVPHADGMVAGRRDENVLCEGMEEQEVDTAVVGIEVDVALLERVCVVEAIAGNLEDTHDAVFAGTS